MRDLKLRPKLLIALGAAALALSAGIQPLGAQTAGNQEQAEKAYAEASELFKARNYDEAATKFIEAYEALPLPELLYNIAQSYRLSGNCKKSYQYYNDFKAAREKEDGKPLADTDPQRASRIDGYLADLEPCAKGEEPKPEEGESTEGGATTSDKPTAGSVELRKKLAMASRRRAKPKLFSIRAGGGAASVQASAETSPVTSSFMLAAGYPMATGAWDLELGVAVDTTPLRYVTTADVKGVATLSSAVANIAISYPVNQFSLRIEVGGGIQAFSGLQAGDPFTMPGYEASGVVIMPHARAAIGLDIDLTRSLYLYLTPLAGGYSKSRMGLATEEILTVGAYAGLGFRM